MQLGGAQLLERGVRHAEPIEQVAKAVLVVGAEGAHAAPQQLRVHVPLRVHKHRVLGGERLLGVLELDEGGLHTERTVGVGHARFGRAECALVKVVALRVPHGAHTLHLPLAPLVQVHALDQEAEVSMHAGALDADEHTQRAADPARSGPRAVRTEAVLRLLDHQCGQLRADLALCDAGAARTGADAGGPTLPDAGRRLGAADWLAFGGALAHLTQGFEPLDARRLILGTHQVAAVRRDDVETVQAIGATRWCLGYGGHTQVEGGHRLSVQRAVKVKHVLLLDDEEGTLPLVLAHMLHQIARFDGISIHIARIQIHDHRSFRARIIVRREKFDHVFHTFGHGHLKWTLIAFRTQIGICSGFHQ
mmetsp:Transcript_38794/g.97754  ORF Transcript_38794/g.97754 Transcript_38794/m.97754 type:complete len:363 (-) Transcript_38794:761-1849(-)